MLYRLLNIRNNYNSYYIKRSKMTASFSMWPSQDIILGGNHSQMAALNMRALLADALLPMEESSKATRIGLLYSVCGGQK